MTMELARPDRFFPPLSSLAPLSLPKGGYGKGEGDLAPGTGDRCQLN
jgi:hypothetical protein